MVHGFQQTMFDEPGRVTVENMVISATELRSRFGLCFLAQLGASSIGPKLPLGVKVLSNRAVNFEDHPTS